MNNCKSFNNTGPVPSLDELYSRYTSVEADIQYAKRERLAAVKSAVDALSSISGEDISRLSEIVPELAEVCTYTVSQLSENINGEYHKVCNVYNTLVRYLDWALKNYEDGIC